MLRTTMFVAILAALGSAFGLYAVSYQTRQLELHARKMERKRLDLVREIAILRAERAYLARPARLAPLARKIGMRPLKGHQFKHIEELTTRRAKW